jgi:hypothetical protein
MQKAVYLTFDRNLTNEEEKLSEQIYDSSRGDPFIFNCMLHTYITKGRAKFGECVSNFIDEHLPPIQANSLHKEIILSSLFGMFGIDSELILSET